jgi:hypothetical protein
MNILHPKIKTVDKLNLFLIDPTEFVNQLLSDSAFQEDESDLRIKYNHENFEYLGSSYVVDYTVAQFSPNKLSISKKKEDQGVRFVEIWEYHTNFGWGLDFKKVADFKYFFEPLSFFYPEPLKVQTKKSKEEGTIFFFFKNSGSSHVYRFDDYEERTRLEVDSRTNDIIRFEGNKLRLFEELEMPDHLKKDILLQV